MALYEIRTLKSRRRISLISYGEFESDLTAILTARHLMRRGEALEVWRGSILVYRFGPPMGGKTPAVEAPAKVGIGAFALRMRSRFSF